jgi:hypothetical protein
MNFIFASKPKDTSAEQISPQESQNIINEYLSENTCGEKIEKFDTMGPNVNIGNNMNFKQEYTQNISPLSKSLSNSLVPDFQPNYLNINPDLNSFGYATTNPQADKYYESRGYIKPKEGQEFADSVSYMLSHPYQTRYCEK